eukprot:m.33924 g.33924  ORF g.33924 m.33924 type:complete len:1745 (+) comp6485_c0_seq2:13-5247(+)
MPPTDWIVLQRKIFTRWVNQRLQKKHLPDLKDVVEDLGKGSHLVKLIEILSEKECTAKFHASPRFKAQELENVNQALEFMFSVGVTMALKPSADNLLEGDERAVLGLVWALMMKYLKFAQEDEENLSPKDALLRWVNLNTKGHAHAHAENFTTSFRSGMVLCALIHKFRPDLIDYDSLVPEESSNNLRKATDAAKLYFGLEEYISPDDVARLDEKSMLVYVSEYYSGITEQLKLDLAFRRLTQLIGFTVQNDSMKESYQSDAASLHQRIIEVESMLEQLPGKKDGTMAGAKRLLQTFNEYRMKEKREMYSDHIKLEALFTNLATRLADNSRPSFKPANQEYSIESRAALLGKLQEKEQGIGLQLHNEVSHQLKLKQQDEDHTQRCGKVDQWIAKHNSNLPDVQNVTSTGMASNILKFLTASEQEIVSLRSTSFEALKSISTTLQSENYEHVDAVKKREAELDTKLSTFNESLISRRPAFEDAYEREMYKEETLRSVKVHQDLCANVEKWVDNGKEYLTTKEVVSSLEDAERQTSLLAAFNAEKDDMVKTSIAALKEVGATVRAAEYKTSFSSWRFEMPETLQLAEEKIDALVVELGQLSVKKSSVLHDDIERETYAQKTRLLADQHVQKATLLGAWAKEKTAYLNTREACDVEDHAQFLLGVLGAYRDEKERLTAVDLASLKSLGKNILGREYKTDHSQYKYEKPEEITQQETALDADWAKLDASAQVSKAILDDHLARNQFQNKVRLWVKGHTDMHAELKGWFTERKAYLQTKEDIDTIQKAELQLSILQAFRQEKTDMTAGSLASLKQLGDEIRKATYETTLSSWVYEYPDAVSDLENEVEKTMWAELDGLADEKKKVLDDDLAREQFKEAIRLKVKNHLSAFDEIEAWYKEKSAYLDKKETISNSEDAKGHLSILTVFDQQLKDTYASDVGNLKSLGEAIRNAKYETVYSSWVFEHPEETTTREGTIDGCWEALREKAIKKREILDDDVARELYAEETRLLADQHSDKTELLLGWFSNKSAYLGERPEVPTTHDSRFHLSVLENFRKQKSVITDTAVKSLHALRATIFARKYETTLSSYVYEMPTVVTQREGDLATKWGELDTDASTKEVVLQDHLARNLFKDDVVLSAKIYSDEYKLLEQWCDEKLSFLNERASINVTQESNLQLNLLEGFVGEKGDKLQGTVASIKSRGASVRSAKYKSEHSSWVYPTPEDTTTLESKIDEWWGRLDGVASEKKIYLDDCLQRNQHIDRVNRLVDRHSGSHQRLVAWSTSKEAELVAQPSVESLSDALVKLRLLDALEVEAGNLEKAAVGSFKALGNEIKGDAYKSALSSWMYPDGAQLESKEADIDSRMGKVTSLVGQERTRLQAEKEKETKKESLRQEFSHSAHSLEGFVQDNIIFVKGAIETEGVKATTFGFSLDETKAAEAELKSNAISLSKLANEKKASCMTIYNNLASFGPVTNPYTKHTEQSLTTILSELQGAISFRAEKYAEALQMQLSNDDLCKQFASLVNPLTKTIRECIDRFAKAEGTLDEQLVLINSELQRMQTLNLDALRKTSEELENRGIEYNPHSSTTLQDIESQVEDYSNMLTYKKPLIEKEIDFKKSRGVTAEHMQEIENFFKQFDQDNSGVIEKRELKACLFSLGEELTSAQVDGYIKQFGTGGVLSLQQFKELMINLIGVIHTREHIIGSFAIIARREDDLVMKTQLVRLSDEHRAYINKSVDSGESFNYVDFTEAMFSK